jgi:hypothetical protein
MPRRSFRLQRPTFSMALYYQHCSVRSRTFPPFYITCSATNTGTVIGRNQTEKDSSRLSSDYDRTFRSENASSHRIHGNKQAISAVHIRRATGDLYACTSLPLLQYPYANLGYSWRVHSAEQQIYGRLKRGSHLSILSAAP